MTNRMTARVTLADVAFMIPLSYQESRGGALDIAAGVRRGQQLHDAGFAFPSHRGLSA
jgi:hypothetical protein